MEEEEFNEIIYDFINSSYYDSLKTTNLSIDKYNYRLALQKQILLFCESRNEDIIIEGIFINELFDNKYIKYPFIIKGTSFFVSMFRLIYRIFNTFIHDHKIIIPDSFYNIIQYKDINDLIRKISNYEVK